MPWHSQRDGFAELASWLALVTGSLGKLGQDVLLLAQNEVGEVREAEGGGSSTMPQKSNPIRAEALVTLARRNTTLVGGMPGDAACDERDGAAWQLEWLALPGMAGGTAAALAHADILLRDHGRRLDRRPPTSRPARACSWPKPQASPWRITCHGRRRSSSSNRPAAMRSAPDGT